MLPFLLPFTPEQVAQTALDCIRAQDRYCTKAMALKVLGRVVRWGSSWTCESQWRPCCSILLRHILGVSLPLARRKLQMNLIRIAKLSLLHGLAAL